MPKQTMILEGTLVPDQEKTYFYVPFDLPAGAALLEVEYDYSDRISSNPLVSGGNTIDLGVFDERGIAFLKAGFRGWSGSERNRFFISENEAAPGYLAGPLIPGRWYVLLGLYKIAPQGCSYRVTINVTTRDDLGATAPAASASAASAPAASASAASASAASASAASASAASAPAATASAALPGILSRDLPSSNPPAPYAPWLRGELHCHTFHSDGELSASQLIALARSRGLDFLAITDHNTIASQQEMEKLTDPGLVLLRGVESTTFKGHFNIWGIPDWVDFRIQSPEEMQAAIQYANDLGALTSCNHPKLYGPPWDFPEVTNFHCVEVWNGPFSGLDEMALEYWTSLIASGRRVPAVGGSDFHNTSEGERSLGTPTNWIYVEGQPSQESILQAVRLGHVTLSDQPNGAFLDLRGGEGLSVMGGDVIPQMVATSAPFQVTCLRGTGCLLQILDQAGVLFEQEITAAESTLAYIHAAAGSRYIRAELRSPEGRLRAMTNPIYID